MTNRRKRRRQPPRPRPAPQTPPPAPELLGWAVDDFARATGVDRIQALTFLRQEMKAGRVVRLQCGERVLWARLGGGHITEVRL